MDDEVWKDIPGYEVWKDIPGYEGLYKISNKGRVYSHYMGRLRKLVKRNNRGGQLQVGLNRGNKQTFYLVSRLVMQVFVKPNLANNDYVVYIDGNIENNKLSNLVIRSTARNDTGCVRVIEGKRCTKYHAVINTAERKQVFLGSFIDRRSAELATYLT